MILENVLFKIKTTRINSKILDNNPYNAQSN
jgi:hypothetical protein